MKHYITMAEATAILSLREAIFHGQKKKVRGPRHFSSILAMYRSAAVKAVADILNDVRKLGARSSTILGLDKPYCRVGVEKRGCVVRFYASGDNNDVTKILAKVKV